MPIQGVPVRRIGASLRRRLGPASAVSVSRTLGLGGEEENGCSFCGKGQDDVRIIAGPNVWICDECVQLCCDIFWPDEEFPWSVPRDVLE